VYYSGADGRSKESMQCLGFLEFGLVRFGTGKAGVMDRYMIDEW